MSIRKIEEVFVPGLVGAKRRRLRILADEAETPATLVASDRLPERAELHPRDDSLEASQIIVTQGADRGEWIVDVYYRNFTGKKERP